MKNRFDLLVFDWDGTLCDSIGWIVKCIQQAALACGVPVPSEEAARSVIGLRTDVAMMELFPGSGGQIVENLVAAYRENQQGVEPRPGSHGYGVILRYRTFRRGRGLQARS